MGFQFVKESGLKGFAQISIMEMFNDSPEVIIREAAFGKKTVDMWISFERPAEGMEDADETMTKFLLLFISWKSLRMILRTV